MGDGKADLEPHEDGQRAAAPRCQGVEDHHLQSKGEVYKLKAKALPSPRALANAPWALRLVATACHWFGRAVWGDSPASASRHTNGILSFFKCLLDLGDNGLHLCIIWSIWQCSILALNECFLAWLVESKETRVCRVILLIYRTSRVLRRW